MVFAAFSLREDYWDEFQLDDTDIEFLYNYLLEIETPLPSDELVAVLVEERIRREIQYLEQRQLEGGDIYFPKETYEPEQQLVFPALGGRTGTVIATRKGWNPEYGEFDVIKVRFDDDDEREFAAGFEDHPLNDPPDLDDNIPTVDEVLESHKDLLVERLESGLFANPDFVRIAFKWFPRALLMDVNAGHLNLAEAVLDMAGGGPLPTSALLEPLDFGVDENPKLVAFSLDLALQEDPRFDEVGPAGEILWHLKRLEPEGILNTPLTLRYTEIDYDRSQLTPEMLELERSLDDELSPLPEADLRPADSVTVSLLYPHWRAGTLPLSPRMRSLFPTAYEAPRIRFMLVDGNTGEKFPGWVVREQAYVFGLEDWYRKRELIPGSIVHVHPGKKPGEVIVSLDAQRSHRDWVRTVLVGTDGGIVFANLKQIVTATYDERLVIAVPDMEMLDRVWEQRQNNQPPFERTVVNMVRELTKLSTQGHMHAAELYAAVNLVRRCPPGPILALLASRPWFEHVGDLHFRLSDVSDR